MCSVLGEWGCQVRLPSHVEREFEPSTSEIIQQVRLFSQPVRLFSQQVRLISQQVRLFIKVRLFNNLDFDKQAFGIHTGFVKQDYYICRAVLSD